MGTILTVILVLTFLSMLAGLVFFIWLGYKLVTYSPTKPELHTCKYKSKGGWEWNTYDTECGKEFYDSTENAIVQHWMSYCPYCGGKVK